MWNRIIGHERQKEQLKRTIRSSNIPHAYLFAGINGIGKKLTAHSMAAALLCKEPLENTTPCEKCSSCQKFLSGTHPDLLEIEPENRMIKIDLIRNIKDQLKFAPLEAERRIVIIDQAEFMNTNAANAALKILEEPPPGNHFFIITATPSQLLPTIVSRCQKMEFSPLTINELQNYLISQCSYTKNQAAVASAIGEGSIERALSITPELTDAVTQNLYTVLASPTIEGVLELSNDWASEKDEIDNILYILHRCFHNALLKRSGVNTGNSSEVSKIIDLISSKNEAERLVEKCNLINKSHPHVARTYNKQLMFEQLLFTLAGQ
jgi:DNA polymerase-3 subunit delta'